MKIGGKAQSLQILKKVGFNVPQFITVDDLSMIPSIMETNFQGVDFFAVRSSASGEDSRNKSFAGQFYSAIGIRKEGISFEARKVISSYKGRSGSVIIQEFIPSESSGVMFTEAGSNRVIINSTLGLCSPVVNGEICDEYICDKSGSILSKTIHEKDTLSFNEGKFTRTKLGTDSLNDLQIRDLARLGSRLQELFGSPQDVEWAYSSGNLFVLQSRPITRAPIITEPVHYDSANIAESYSGVVLPLTFSFAKMVYSRVYKDLLHKSGVSAKKLDKHSDIFDNLLGDFFGRMFYNMNNWYRMAEFVPGYRRNKQNFEAMITSNIKKDVNTIIRPSIALRLAYPIIVINKVLTYGAVSRRFKKEVHKELNLLRRKDFTDADYDECTKLFDEINNKLLRKWYITLENDFLVMTYLGLLKKVTTETEMQLALVFPSKATQQVEALSRLSKKIAKVDRLWNAVQNGDSKMFDTEIVNHVDIKSELDGYLDTFGGRFANELKLESVGVDEDRSKLLFLLKLYHTYKVRMAPHDGMIKDIFLSGFKKRFILRKFRKYASQREEFRLLRSNSFAMARKLFRRLGKILHEMGSLESGDDIFYLTLEEIFNTEKFSKKYKQIIVQRKSDYESYKDINLPSHFSTTNGQPSVSGHSTLDIAGKMVGQPASSGKIKGRIRVFKDFFMPSQIDFDILVTSHTDPGWTPLIALSKGLIIEHGGILSHASIVARELGIPTVIGVEKATSLLSDGDIVEIDGSSGIIKIQK